jgi:hypothetical protein
MGNKVSAPVEHHEHHEHLSPMLRSGMRSAHGSIRPRTSNATSLSQHTRTTPRSIDVVDAASLATLSLRPSTTGLSPPRPLATTLKHRKIGRTALAFFSCGRNVFIHFAGVALLERQLIKATLGTKALEDAAEQVWIEIAMYDPKHRVIWEDAAREARAELIGETLTADVLLEAHCVPQHRARYQILAARAVDEVLKRYAAGTWPKGNDRGFAPDVVAAARRASSYTPNKSEARESTIDHSIERDIVSAINLRDLPSHQFIGVEPSIRRFNLASSVYSRDIDQSSVRSVTPQPTVQESYPYPTTGPTEVIDAAATARLYLDLNMTPPRSNRDSLQSITASLFTNIDTEAEIVTTERVTPAKAKIVDC